jgi:hypothetical protein
MKLLGLPQTMSPADLSEMIHSSISYAFTVYNDDAIVYAASAQGGPGHPSPPEPRPVITPPLPMPEPSLPPIGVPTLPGEIGYKDGPCFPTPPTIGDPMFATLAIGPAMVPALYLAGRLMATYGRPSIVPFAKGSLALRLALAAGAGELLDLLTPGFDLPSPSDIPGALREVTRATWDIINTVVELPEDLFRQFLSTGRNGRMIPEDTEGHGPIVKTWRAPEPDGVPFVLTQQGWIGARRLNGTWSWYKPKKPMVITPGIPLDARQARKLALIYKREKKKAAKVFGLVERKPKSSAKNGMRVVRTGHGDDVVVIND